MRLDLWDRKDLPGHQVHLGYQVTACQDNQESQAHLAHKDTQESGNQECQVCRANLEGSDHRDQGES